MKQLLGVIVFTIFSYVAVGQSIKKLLEVSIDSTFIESYYNDLVLRIYSGEKSHSLELTDLNNGYNLEYLPNGYFNMGFGFNYKFIGLSFASKIPIFINSEAKRGETKRFGFTSYLYTGKLSVDVLMSYMNGYYLNNSFSHFIGYSKDKEYIRPDLTSVNFGSSINYVLNNSKFSYKAAFSDTEKQIKSAGSLLFGGSIFSYNTHADSSIVPREIGAESFYKTRDLSRIQILAINANIGYAYNFVVLKDGLISLSYVFGNGFQKNSFVGVTDERANIWRFGTRHTGRLGLGYRFYDYYGRVAVIRSSQFTNLKYNEISLANGINFMEISVSKRFTLDKNKLKWLQ